MDSVNEGFNRQNATEGRMIVSPSSGQPINQDSGEKENENNACHLRHHGDKSNKNEFYKQRHAGRHLIIRQRRRREIFVEPRTIKFPSSVRSGIFRGCRS